MKALKLTQYLILIRDDEIGWHDCGEGPWDKWDDALTFARNEVGIPWVIVSVQLTEKIDN